MSYEGISDRPELQGPSQPAPDTTVPHLWIPTRSEVPATTLAPSTVADRPTRMLRPSGTPAFIPSKEDVSYGQADHLPDASVLQGVSKKEWRDHTLGSRQHIATLPGHPDIVVRRHSTMALDDGQMPTAMVKKGIDHLQRMTEDIELPPQRFFVAPVPGGGPKALYSCTDYLEGRELTYDRKDDKVHGQTVVNNQDSYVRWAMQNPHEPDFLWDNARPEQYTIKPDGQLAIHDLGLDFAPTDRAVWRDETIRCISHWVAKSGLQEPEGYRELLKLRDI